jgi:hypothetical protein
MSINATTIRIGQVIGPPVMTLAYVYGGYRATYFLTAIVASLVVAVTGIAGKIVKTTSSGNNTYTGSNF